MLIAVRLYRFQKPFAALRTLRGSSLTLRGPLRPSPIILHGQLALEKRMTDTPPLIGAAMPVAYLAEHRDWLIADQRDLELWDFSYPDVLDDGWRGLARQARDLLDGYKGRLGIHGPWEGLALTSGDRRAQALTVERYRQGLECAGALGATHMVIHSPFDFFGSPHVAHAASLDLPELIGQAHAVLDQVLPLAAEIGCALVVEVCSDTATAPLLALVRSFASDYLRASLDTGHAFVMQRIGGPPPDQWVRDAGPLLAHMHIQDTDGLYDRHWAPGEGSINWFALFEALGEQHHCPRLLLELNHPAKIRRATRWFADRELAR
jgi:sugar phosphate isomerase/epimerase